MNKAQVILEHLGGNKFLVMTGAKDLMNGGDYLSFKLPRGFAANGVNLVKITLDPSDTYTVETLRIRGASVVTVAEASMVYVDSLQNVVESQTGFYLTLGNLTTGKARDR